MPLAGVYTWEEDLIHLVLKIPLKGSSRKKADILISKLYLKISYPPYLLEFDLAKEVKEEYAKAIYEKEVLILRLRKAEEALWGDLLFHSDKETRLERRKCSLDERQRKVQSQHERAKLKRVEEERFSVRKQMALEHSERTCIEELKEESKKLAEKKLYEDISRIHSKEQATEDTEKNVWSKSQNLALRLKDYDDLPNLNKTCEVKNTVPRPATLLLFKHTPRIFKTPIRESTKQQEREFIAKNRPYLKNNHHFNKDGLDISHTDPTWLKSRGDSFLRNKDYYSAINAYSAAFDKDSNMIPALMNRSVCYLELGEDLRCINDCTLVNEKFGTIDHQQTESNIEDMKRKNYVRLGFAYFYLFDYQKASYWLNEALKIKECKKLSRDLRQVDIVLQAYTWKSNADKALSAGDIQEAIEMYQKAIDIDANCVAAKYNFATLAFSQQRFQDCINACSEVLSILSLTSKRSEINLNTSQFLLESIPRPGSKRRREIVIASFCTRGSAYAEMGKIQRGYEDFLEVKKINGQMSSVSTSKLDKIIENLEDLLK